MEIVKTKSGEQRFKVKVRLQNGRAITKNFKTKMHAKQWKMKMETEKLQGILGISVAKSVPFAEVAQKWFDTKVKNVLSSKTVCNYKSNLFGKVIPYFGKMDINKVKLPNIEDFRCKYIDLGLNPKTINKTMTMIRQILLFAVERGHMLSLPFNRSLLLKTVKTPMNYFEEHEIRALLIRNRTNVIYPMIYLVIHTGMRLGEICGLTWDRINLIGSRIEISQTMGSRGVIQYKTKSRKTRYFPLNGELRKFFDELRRHQKDPRFIFVNEKGQPFSPDHFCQRHFKPACKNAGVRELRFHDLRHTFASHFMMMGGNLYELKGLLGHANISQTEDYAHLSPTHLEKASQVVNFGISFENEKADGSFLALAANK